MIFSHVYSVIGIKRILKFNWCIFFFRLTPSLMLLMFVYVPLFPYISDGPFWPQKGLEQGQCNKTWWYNMLYINNFFNEVSFNVDILSNEKNAQFFLFYSYFICLHILSWHHDLQTVMYKLARFNTRLFALYCILHWLTIVICMNGFITVYLSSYINVHEMAVSLHQNISD